MMELLTLSELNRGFMAESGTAKPDMQPDVHPVQRARLEDRRKLEPITPIAIEVKLPGAPGASAEDPELSANTPLSGRPNQQHKQKNNSSGFESRQEGKREGNRKNSGIFAFISNLIFYLAIILIMLTVLTSGTDAGVPKTIFGYSYFTVVSHSMQDEIPKGSFILVKSIDSQELAIGDVITYMRDRNTSITHKIVDIYENYNNSGTRGFQTKGVNNANPDVDVVHGSTIVGKVLFVLPAVGELMAYLAANVYIVFIIFGLCVIISFCLRGLFVKSKNKKQLIKNSQEEH